MSAPRGPGLKESELPLQALIQSMAFAPLGPTTRPTAFFGSLLAAHFIKPASSTGEANENS